MKRVFTVVLAMLIGFSVYGQQLSKMPPKGTFQKKIVQKVLSKRQLVENKNFKSVNTYSQTKSLLNYDFTESSTTFTSIHTTGTAITPSGWDDGYYYLDLSGNFSFDYDLNPISSFSIGTNGYVILGVDKYPSLSNDLASTEYVPAVAPIWDDMRFYGEGTNCGIFYQIDESPTDTVLTIEWFNLERYTFPGDSVTYQVKFHTNGDVIEMIYGDMSRASGWDASATIGINNTEGSSTAFMSITPGSPATMSRTESNNTIDGATIAGIAEGTVYTFTPNFLNNDLVASEILPNAGTPDADITPQVRVYNAGLNSASNYTVQLVIDDESSNEVYNQSLTISDELASGSDTLIDMPVWSSVPAGFYSATFTITYASDENTSNNETNSTITVLNSIVMSDGSDTLCGALFYDSGGETGDYQSGEDYTLTLYPSTAGNFLQVHFNNYDIENGYDFLYVYNGTSTSDELLATLTGSGSDLTLKGMNPDGALTFHFTSDGSVQQSGWEAILSCYTPPQHDLAVTQVSPSAVRLGVAFTPQVVITNYAVNDESSYDINYTNEDGSYSGTLTFNNTVSAMGGADTVNLPSWTLSANDTLTVTVVLSGDEDNSNDELVQPIAVINSSTLAGNTSTGEYSFIDLSNANEFAVGSINSTPFPMAEEFDGTNIYRIYNDMSFGTVDMSGNFTSMGQLTGFSGTPTGLAWDWNNNVMYVMVLDANNAPHLCTLDLNSLELTEVASNSAGMIIGIEWVNDTIYGPSIDDDSFYKIDLSDGSYTNLGAIGVDLNYGQDVAYDYDSSRLYTITEGASELLGYYDLTTGAFTQTVSSSGQHATFVSLTTPVDLYTVTFHVTDGTNDVANATINVAGRSLTTDASGLATLNLADGNYSAYTSAYGFSNDTTDFTVSGADLTVDITLTELPQYDLVFHVTNILGTDIENAKVTVMYGTDTLANGLTDATGIFDAGQQYADYTFDYFASADGYENYQGTVILNGDTTVAVQLIEKMNPPSQLTYTLDGQNATLNWSEPSSFAGEPQWIQYDDGTNSDAIGTGGSANFDVAARFMPADIADLDGGVITHVEFFPAEAAATYTIEIWQGSDAANLIYSEEVTNPTIGEMNDITLASEVPFDVTQELWIGYNVNTTTGYPAGIDGSSAVDGYGNMIYFNGAWGSLLSDYGLDGNWNIHAYVEAPSKSKSFQNAYNVYLQDTLVTQTPISDTTYQFVNLDYGHYKAGVTAIYETGESDTATVEFDILHQYDVVFNVLNAEDSSAIEGASVTFANTDTTFNLTTDVNGLTDTVNTTEGDYTYTASATGFVTASNVPVTVSSDTVYTVYLQVDHTVITANGNEIVAYPNPTYDVLNVKVNGNYNMVITDIDGRTVMATKLHNDINSINVANLPAGIYFVNLRNGSYNYNFKIVKK